MPALDGLRGIAALVVVVSHYSNETNLWNGLLGSGAGQAGVILFFILTGFLITHLHINEEFSCRNIGSYGIRRTSRVYPYFVVVAALPAFLIWVGFPGKIGMSDIDSIPVYLRQILLIDRGSNVFWTIQVEIIFYASFLAMWALYRAVKSYLLVFSVLSLILVFCLYVKPKTGFLFFDSGHIFLIGVLSAIAYRWTSSEKNGFLWSVVGVMLLLSVPLTFPVVYLSLVGSKIDPWFSVLMLSQLAILFNVALRGGGALNYILSSRLLVWFGKISYSMYLLHYFVLVGFLSLAGPVTNHLLYFSCVMIMVIVVSWAGYRYVEMPIQKITLKIPVLIGSITKLAMAGRATRVS